MNRGILKKCLNFLKKFLKKVELNTWKCQKNSLPLRGNFWKKLQWISEWGEKANEVQSIKKLKINSKKKDLKIFLEDKGLNNLH